MIETSTRRSLCSILFFSSFSLQFFPGMSDDSSGSSHKMGTGVAIMILVVAAVLLFAIFLFKMWQKKKRDEQYARLSKLFEEDDELEVELGLKD